MKTRMIDVGLIETNQGQIAGVPKNPRLIRDARFEKLKASIQDLPEMMDLREVIVFPLGKKFIAIGGNMRLLGCKELLWSTVPCKVLPANTSAEVLRKIAIKDNVGFGEDDMSLLKTDWNPEELADWGMELPVMVIPEGETEDEQAGNMKHQKQIRLSYPEQTYLSVKEKLAELAETPELALLKLLKME